MRTHLLIIDPQNDFCDIDGAAQLFAAILQADPDNTQAIAGLAECMIGANQHQRARELLTHRNITVITNNMNVANILVANPGCEIVVAGGALRRTDGRAYGKAGGNDRPDRPPHVDGQHRRHGTSKTDDRSHRQIDMTRHDHQKHPQRHDDDVRVLQEQVGDVLRRQEIDALHPHDGREEQHDRQQGKDHPVFAQVAAQMRPESLLGFRHHATFAFSFFKISAMIRS